MSERVSSGDVVYEQGTRSATVVATRYALKRLLAGCVPDLQLDVLFVYLDRACAELDTNCQIVLLSEAFVSELQQ